MTVMTFGATCSPYCAQFVKNYNADQHRDEFPEAAAAITDQHYVDDLLASVDTIEQAHKLFQDVSYVHKQAGFLIRNWISSSPELIRMIPEELRSKSQKSFTGKETLTSERVLGLLWNPDEDKLTFNTSFPKVHPEILAGTAVPTKREALSLVMSTFDAMGFAANLTVKAKILLQKAWRLGLYWHDHLPDSLAELFKIWILELQSIT